MPGASKVGVVSSSLIKGRIFISLIINVAGFNLGCLWNSKSFASILGLSRWCSLVPQGARRCDSGDVVAKGRGRGHVVQSLPKHGIFISLNL